MKEPAVVLLIAYAAVFAAALVWRVGAFLWILLRPGKKTGACPPGFAPHPCDLRTPPRRFIRDPKLTRDHENH
jgi:hypothetical protein